jgi:uncharacterized protein (TIGR02421 family)
VAALVRGIVETLAAEFGAFLILELWSGSDEGKASDPASPFVPPAFRILAPKSTALSPTTEALRSHLSQIRVLKQSVEVELAREKRRRPPGLEPLIDRKQAIAWNCSTVGLVVPPIYRNLATGQSFPPLMRAFRRDIGHALKRTFYQFTRSRTTHRPPHYHELGRRAVVKAVWDVDRQLSEVSTAFDFLLQVTPINSDEAWRAFQRSKFERAPEFHYRPTPYEPSLLKRRLFRIPLERIEDPALQHIFLQKQSELDRKITMIADRETPRFLYCGLQLYGGVEQDLHDLAGALLERVPTRSRDEPAKEQLDAGAFAARATAQFEQYRADAPDFAADARVTPEVAGIMVSGGTLLINPKLTVPLTRVDALLQHEVGTHLLTYFNGLAQPFRLLCSGLAGYDELQEGLAVLSEYLVGGLSRPRLRQLAARVIAAKQLTEGATFVDTFRTLDRTFKFSQRVAYGITMRIYRGGGLTKDAVYLRGLRQILRYLGDGGDLDSLFVGKIAVEHVPIVKELTIRRVLKAAPVRPLYMRNEAALERLARVCGSPTSVLDLVPEIESGKRPGHSKKSSVRKPPIQRGEKEDS